MTAYTAIPSLVQLIGTSGRPGVRYAIVLTSHMLRAQKEGWEDLAGGTKVFPIEGPKGTAECVLRAKGKPIKSQQGQYKSPMFVDKGVREATGLGAVEPELPSVKAK